MICPNCGFEHDVDLAGPVCTNCGMPVVYEEPPPLEEQSAPPPAYESGFGAATGEMEWSEEPSNEPEAYVAPEQPVKPAVEPAPAAPMPANCPHCGAAHSPSQGRFCESCGMSVVAYAARGARRDPDAPVGEEDVVKVRCRYCGVRAPPPICPACGTNLPEPED